MTTYIVTIKLLLPPKRHDPSKKILGLCPINADSRRIEPVCTDTTGKHHSMLIDTDSITSAIKSAEAKYGHVTRIEEARWM